MTVSTRNTLLAGVGLFSIAILGGIAYAGGGPVATPKVQPDPSHPGPCCKGPKGPAVHIPGVHVAGPNVMVHGSNVSVHQGSIIKQTQTFLNTNIVGSSESSVVVAGGGGFFASPGVQATAIGQLNVEGGEETFLETITEKVPTTEEYCEDKITIKSITRPLQAVCIDDKGVPHPASRVDASDRVPTTYHGELFRCMAGTSMQVTLGTIENGTASFDHGETFACRKGEALVHRRGGDLTCAPQTPQRDCNERSLLRRHGPGIKFFEAEMKAKTCIPRTRTVMTTVQRQVERVVESKPQSMVFDGGVGQGVN
ncbi:MAG: hypothetical protein AAGG72_07020 [Pseudomonadota bacterium]